MSASSAFTIRAFDPADRSQVVTLLRRVLDRPGERVHDDAYFAWKHLDNPFGRSVMLVAEAEGRIIGFRAIMRWQLAAGDVLVNAGRPVDTVTDPEWRRLGVFSGLTTSVLGRIEEMGIELLFNTPNDQSFPGYLKMGWTALGRARQEVLVGGPAVWGKVALARLGRNGRAAAGPGLESDAVWTTLAGRLTRPRSTLQVVKTEAYLRWRYARHPWFRYRVIGAGPAAVVRVASGGRVPVAILAESTASAADEWEELLPRVAAAAGAPVLEALGTPGVGPGRTRGWFRMEREGPALVVRSDQRRFTDIAEWSLTTGELEFF